MAAIDLFKNNIVKWTIRLFFAFTFVAIHIITFLVVKYVVNLAESKLAIHYIPPELSSSLHSVNLSIIALLIATVIFSIFSARKPIVMYEWLLNIEIPVLTGVILYSFFIEKVHFHTLFIATVIAVSIIALVFNALNLKKNTTIRLILNLTLIVWTFFFAFQWIIFVKNNLNIIHSVALFVLDCVPNNQVYFTNTLIISVKAFIIVFPVLLLLSGIYRSIITMQNLLTNNSLIKSGKVTSIAILCLCVMFWGSINLTESIISTKSNKADYYINTEKWISNGDLIKLIEIPQSTD